MRREEEFFNGQELELVYIAKRLSEAKELEARFEAAEVDYLVETDYYVGGFLFRSERAGAFFYVAEGAEAKARALLRGWGWRAYEAEG
jgi:hypothetical protein